ncbi:MAG: YdcF family protein [Cytophagaceae bacterium]|nr:YdcF family protein [Cytophagaceae bacterium]
MFFVLSKLLYGLVSPLSWVFYALIWAVFSRRYRRRAVLVAMAILYLGSTDFLVSRLLRGWEDDPVELTGKPYDVAIILTGGILSEGSRSREDYSFGPSSDRLLQPLLLYKKGRIKRILISGGEAKISEGIFPDEGQIAADFLKACGVDSSAIRREGRSRNTYENARYTAELLRKQPQQRLLLVTSALHMKRATACFRHAGLTVTPYPVDFRSGPTGIAPGQFWPSEEALERFNRLVHEWVGYFTYRVLGYC